MLWVWITLCLMWQGASSFMIHNAVESLCLEDSVASGGVELKKCTVGSMLQEWVWIDGWLLMNMATQRCLSAFELDPVLTADCDGREHLQWECTNHRLISLNHSLELGAKKDKLVLTHRDKNTRWKSLDEGNICQERLRSRRQSEFAEEGHKADMMTEEQRAYLQWYYRTEDATSWNFAMLALSFVALLLGCMLLVMGLMGNKNRKKIAKYKAAAAVLSPVAKVEMEELQVITEPKNDKNSFNTPTQDSTQPEGDASDTESLKPGEIIVTWKDGNVSNLYSDAPEEGEDEKL